MDDENRDGFDTPTVVPSDVGEETQSFAQEHVEIVKHQHDECQEKESGCSVDAMMDMEDENRDVFVTPTVVPSDVGEEKQSFDQAHVGEILKHDEQQGKQSSCSVDATMDMEEENNDESDMPAVLPPVGEEKPSFAQEHVVVVKHEHCEQQGREGSCSVDVSVHMECSKLKEEENASLNLDMEKKDDQLVEDSKTVDSEDENYLSNKYPFFNVILAKSHVKRPNELIIPDNFLPALPHGTVPVVIRCGGKNWNMSCIKNGEERMLCAKWRKFVIRNDLKIGDACVFELRECSETEMKFKVILLRNDLPPELQGKMKSVGGTEGNPIELD